jgi:hypothetical protein
MPARGQPVRIGDVFVVPLSETVWAAGQIVAKYLDEAEYMVLFRSAYASESIPDAATATADEVVMLALSLDGRIHQGAWRVIGNASPVSVEMPIYKIAVDVDQYVVVDHLGSQIRVATDGDVATLPNRKVVAPIRVEQALQAMHGLRDWEPRFDDLRWPR